MIGTALILLSLINSDFEFTSFKIELVIMKMEDSFLNSLTIKYNSLLRLRLSELNNFVI